MIYFFLGQSSIILNCLKIIVFIHFFFQILLLIFRSISLHFFFFQSLDRSLIRSLFEDNIVHPVFKILLFIFGLLVCSFFFFFFFIV